MPTENERLLVMGIVKGQMIELKLGRKPVRFLSKTAALVILVFAMVTIVPRQSKAEPMREFLMSCTYGVLAGALVGAATLAFRDNPGEHLKSIAVGASVGLYAGILLGAYVVYVVPGQYEEEDVRYFQPSEPKALLVPQFNLEGGLDGAQVQYSLISF
jgi:hypothetical protein